MKANRIPVVDRLQARITKLWSRIRYGDYWNNRRFYPKCIYCGITNVACDIAGGKHHQGCLVPGVLKEIAYYEGLLTQARTLHDHQSETGRSARVVPDCG